MNPKLAGAAALGTEDWLATKQPAGFPMLPLLEAEIIPAKFGECLEHNQLLRACCRKPENMTARLFKSNPRLAQPDGFVATCVCGRNHIRVRNDPVRLGVKESEAEKLARASSILEQPYESAPKTGDVIHARTPGRKATPRHP